MTTPEEEQDHWDLRAAMPEMWSEPDEDAGAGFCMSLLIPVLEKAAARQSFLDLGCGIGRLTRPVALAFPEAMVIGVDISPKALSRAAAEGQVASENLGFILGDGRNIPLDAPISGGWSFAMLHHIPVDAQVHYLVQVADLLEPGGRFLAQLTQGGDISDWNQPMTASLTLEAELAARQVVYRWEQSDRFPTWLLLYLWKQDT